MPLMGLPVENAGEGSSTKHQKQMTVHAKVGTPIIVPLKASIISLQRELKSILRWEFFQNTANRTWITTKIIVDYNAIQKCLTEKNFHFFPVYTMANKPPSCIFRHFLAIFPKRISLWPFRR
jgi:hypothetical protein